MAAGQGRPQPPFCCNAGVLGRSESVGDDIALCIILLQASIIWVICDIMFIIPIMSPPCIIPSPCIVLLPGVPLSGAVQIPHG